MDGLPGKIGGYVIEKLLGQGGMGAVYRARDPVTGRSVALKVLRDAEPGGTRRARFVREATLLARLSSPYVVSVHASGEDNQTGPFFVMELIEGTSLRERLARGVLPAREAADVGRQVARGLDALHAVGVIHRDVKPENVILAPGRGAVLVDLGVGKDLDSSIELTKSRAIVGTAYYIPPEALRSSARDVTPRSDVYSLGAVLHELLSGLPPFGGETALEIFEATLDSPTPKLVGVPADLAAIVARCLEKEPIHRYPSAEALAVDLETFLAGKRTVALTERLARRRGRAVVTGAVAALAILVGAGALWFAHARDRRVAAVTALVQLALAVDVRQPIPAARLADLEARRAALAPAEGDAALALEARADARLHLLRACAALDEADATKALEAGCEVLGLGDVSALDRALEAVGRTLETDPRRAVQALERASARGEALRCERCLVRARIALASRLADPERRQALTRARAAAPVAFNAAVADWVQGEARPLAARDFDRALGLAHAFAAAIPAGPRPSPAARLASELHLERASARRVKGDLEGVIEDRLQAFAACPEVEAPPWYPGLTCRLATESGFALEAAQGDPKRADALRCRAVLEALADGGDASWTVTQVGPLETYMDGYTSRIERRLAQAALHLHQHEVLDVLDAVDRDLDREWEESPPRYRALARALVLRDALSARPLPEPDPLPGDAAGERVAAAVTLRHRRSSRESIPVDLFPLIEVARATAQTRWLAVATAARQAPGDKDLELSEKLARRRIVDALECVALAARDVLHVKGARVDAMNVAARRGLPPVREALELCPTEPEFRSLILRAIELELARQAEGPQAALEAAARADADPSLQAVLDSPSSALPALRSPVFQLSMARAQCDLEVDPPRLDDAEMSLARAEMLSDSVFLNDSDERAKITDMRARIALLRKTSPPR